MIDELCEALEADLKHYYQEPLTGLFTRRYTIRQLVIWIGHLPESSALGRRGFGETKFDATTRWQVNLINTIRAVNWNPEKEGDEPPEGYFIELPE